MTTTTNHDQGVPADRVLEQWKGQLWQQPDRGPDYREVLVTRYGDGSMTVCWRPDRWSVWSPWTEMVET